MQLKPARNQLSRDIGLALGIVLLLVWPFAAVSMLRGISTIAAIGLWGLSYIAATLLLLHVVVKWSNAKGLGFVNAQAAGLAGKTPGILAPRLVIPLGFLLVSAICVRNILQFKYLFESAFLLAVALSLLLLLLRAVWKSKKQRRRLLLRLGANTERATRNHGSVETCSSSEAIEFIGSVLHVPTHAIVKADRFGYEIGQLSVFDQTLDVIGGRLKLLQRQSGRALELSKIETVGDFSAEWSKCQEHVVR